MKTSDLCLTSIQRARLQMDALNLLINHQMVYFPIDIFRLAKKAFNITIIKYSEVTEKALAYIRKINELNAGFTVVLKYSNGAKAYIIYYNDSVCIERQRFTIAHELKHIYYDEVDYDYHDEIGAECFASTLLAPQCVAITNDLLTIPKIKRYFKISSSAAQVLIQKIDSRFVKYGNILFDFEKEFLRKRDEIISKNKHI